MKTPVEIIVLGHEEEENRFCKSCVPVYSSEQLSMAATVYLHDTFPVPTQVRHLDASNPVVYAEYLDLIRLAKRNGMRFPLVLIEGEIMLSGSAEPYALARALRSYLEEKEQEEPTIFAR